MKIHFDWPPSRPSVTLNDSLTIETPAIFDVVTGHFNQDNAYPERDVVAFYWHMGRPVMLSLCADHICRLDGCELEYGSLVPLGDKSQLQAGHFQMTMTRGDGEEEDDRAFYQLIYPDGAWQAADKVPEIEDILPNGCYYINNINSLEDIMQMQYGADDVLKTLEVEYKRFLIRQEQGRGFYDVVDPSANYTIKTDELFDSLREQIKGKTLAECIVARDFLMEKVWPEIERAEVMDDIFSEEDKTDLLVAISPEYIVYKGKKTVSELVSQEFYKVGLDSYY